MLKASVLDDLCAVAGYTATRVLVAWYGGRWLYIPREASVSHPLRVLIGMPALRALCAEFPLERIYVPGEAEDERFRRNKLVAEALCRGDTLEQIAVSHALTVRRVRQLASELEAAGWVAWAEGTGGRRRYLLENFGTNEVVRDSPLPVRAARLVADLATSERVAEAR